MGRSNQTSDDRIVELYWQRSESAISETADKYGDYCNYIAYNILYNREDAEESVNDTWLDAWNNMPPHKPSILSTFLGKITRRISIDRWRKKHAGKRGGGEMDLVKRDEHGNILNSVCHLLTRPNENEELDIDQDFLLERVLRKHPNVIGVGEIRAAAECM